MKKHVVFYIGEEKPHFRFISSLGIVHGNFFFINTSIPALELDQIRSYALLLLI